MSSSASRIEYSEKYADDLNEYRHVILPKELAKTLPKSRLLSELSGEELVCNRVEGGNIMPFTVPNPTFFFFVDPLVLTLKADELIPKWNGRPERNTVPNINANQTNGKQQWDNK
eukprot:CAMPEP_0172355882 /NCGR_PEP_ID=MMETSP1060-20121228/266_1 /TAXON_ID=37318 /ORGANISM="Pseudo-nitzschia pungens, Strain cf. cingulata" /LENGTH=114 /DNA_ID=CAMNT_0013075743 /DNA_START=79 /DNA_END=424 /DNA_ORIENTATION=+